MVDASASELLDPVTVRALKRRETAHIKWLEEVRYRSPYEAKDE